jgi:hypothetical protein
MSGKTLTWLMAVVAVAGGCRHDSAPRPNVADAFGNEPAVHPIDQITAAQAASGAREDATLRAMHFDGPNLNSLGRQKLDLMARDEDASRPIVVYLDLPADAPGREARQSVADFLHSIGVSEQQFRLKDGPNPAVSAPAAKAMDDLHHLSKHKNDAQYDSSGTPQPIVPLSGMPQGTADH